MAEQRNPKPFRDRFYFRYAPVAEEVPALLRLQNPKLRSITSPRTVLIVNCCLIGDFVLSLPALTEFISEHAGARIDLLVSPSVAALAEKLRGVHRIYAARTVFRRDTELEQSERLAPSYDFAIVLRLSGPARRLLATTSYRAIRTCLIPLLKQGFQIATRPISQIKQMKDLGTSGESGRVLKSCFPNFMPTAAKIVRIDGNLLNSIAEKWKRRPRNGATSGAASRSSRMARASFSSMRATSLKRRASYASV